MKNAGILLLALVVAVGVAAAPPPGDEQDRAAIEKAVLDYLEGWYTGDAVRMERALHPELAKRMVANDPKTGRSFVQPIGASAMIAYAAAGVGKLKAGEAAGIEVAILDVFHDMAMVRAKSVHFIDYVQLGRLDGQWRIVNVLWERSAPPPPPAPPAPPR
jgi:hypothetical protein